MQVRKTTAAAVWIAITACSVGLFAQPPAGGQAGARRQGGGFIPGQQRAPEDPAVVARGKTLYGVSCTACHGADLRGGDIGGPNLLRSQLALSDQTGEAIVPIILHGRPPAMPAIPMKDADANAVAAYVRTVLATIGRQGMPPGVGKAPPTILVGDAKAGQKFFDSKCSGCHSSTTDLKGIATKIADPKMLQNAWVAGGARSRGFGPPPPPSPARTPTVTITQASGEKVEGKLLRIDDFYVTVSLADGTPRTFRRDGDVPKVEVRDPMKGHRELLAVYTDRDIHDVTAYLVTLK